MAFSDQAGRQEAGPSPGGPAQGNREKMQGTGAAILKLEGPEDFRDHPNHHRDSAWQAVQDRQIVSLWASVRGRQTPSQLPETYRHSHGLLPPVCRPGIPYFQLEHTRA